MSHGLFATGLPFNPISLNSGVVVYGVIIKRPFQSSNPSLAADEYERGRRCIELEKNIYRRLKHCDGVIPPIDLSGPAILLPLINNGTLEQFLRNHPRPARARQLRWAKEMALTLSQIHDRRVLVVDIASRNMLLHRNGSILFCDFGSSAILPTGTDIWTAEHGGFSFETDICGLGAVMYEVTTGRRIVDFDLITANGDGWPPRDKLPSTQGIWLGPVIEACWTKGKFRTTYELCQMLDNLGFLPLFRQSPCSHTPNALIVVDFGPDVMSALRASRGILLVTAPIYSVTLSTLLAGRQSKRLAALSALLPSLARANVGSLTGRRRRVLAPRPLGFSEFGCFCRRMRDGGGHDDDDKTDLLAEVSVVYEGHTAVSGGQRTLSKIDKMH
ncbi:hypothetical protein LTS15_011289 [Exophiala xenobiotica]|nr:hypothetical protein LTS15_011289 [Exophiala xenobiotica]